MDTGRGPRRWTLVRASRVAVPASVGRFRERARQRRRHAAAPWLALIVGAAVLGALAVVVYATPLLGVRDVRIRGNAMVSADDVRSAAAVPDGAPLASLDLAAIGRRVGRLPEVRQVRVGRDWPSTVDITVVERTAVAAVPVGDHMFRLIDGDGVAFRSVPAPPSGLAVLVLADPGPDDPGTRAGLAVLAEVSGRLRAALARVVVTAPSRISLELSDGRTVVWGDASDGEAKAVAATAMLDRPGKVIDVSAPSLVTVN